MLVQARSDSPICFVMDSLSVLLSFGIEVQEILLFVRHCFRILSSKQVCYLHFYYPCPRGRRVQYLVCVCVCVSVCLFVTTKLL